MSVLPVRPSAWAYAFWTSTKAALAAALPMFWDPVTTPGPNPVAAPVVPRSPVTTVRPTLVRPAPPVRTP